MDIENIFPQSEERRGVAKSLMWFNHVPSAEEYEELAEQVDRSVRTVKRVMSKLKEEGLFTTELGSIPLYRAVQKMEVHPSRHRVRHNHSTVTGAPQEAPCQAPPVQALDDSDDNMDNDDEPAMKVRFMSPRKAEQLEQEQRSLNRRVDSLEAQITDGLQGVMQYLKHSAGSKAVSPQQGLQPLQVEAQHGLDVEVEEDEQTESVDPMDTVLTTGPYGCPR